MVKDTGSPRVTRQDPYHTWRGTGMEKGVKGEVIFRYCGPMENLAILSALLGDDHIWCINWLIFPS